MRALGWIAATVTLLVAAMYMMASLYRWEWNRTLFFGLIVLITEIALATALVLRRLSRLVVHEVAEPELLNVLRDTRPARPNRFAWLEETAGRTNVFITFLVGGGALLSAAAWVVDRLASHSATPIAEARLARQLEPIAHPPGGLIVDDMTVLAQAVPGCNDGQLRALLRRAGHEI